MYVDDFGGAEETEEKARESFEEMGNLLKELGLDETVEKAEGNQLLMETMKISVSSNQVRHKR